jgi:SAM-dependent methyltransferase
MTWASERCVEVPIGRLMVSRFGGRNVLEVGNVLSHYGPISHEVLDKFERGPRIINEDIVTFSSARKYDLILSISTFEHIGFDDEADQPAGRKIQEAIQACRRLLTSNGRLVITVPIGYNPDLDELIQRGALGTSKEVFLKRKARLAWEEVNKAQGMASRYRSPFPYANAILVAEFGPETPIG